MSDVKLELALNSFDDNKFSELVQRVESIVTVRSMLELGDNEDNRKRLYELNKLCSADIPGRGEFYEYEEFCRLRYGKNYDPAHAMIAIIATDWVGLSVNSNLSNRGFMFTEMTGVVKNQRNKNISLLLKIYGIRAAKLTDAKTIYTTTIDKNIGSINMNKRLGFVLQTLGSSA